MMRGVFFLQKRIYPCIASQVGGVDKKIDDLETKLRDLSARKLMAQSSIKKSWIEIGFDASWIVYGSEYFRMLFELNLSHTKIGVAALGAGLFSRLVRINMNQAKRDLITIEKETQTTQKELSYIRKDRC